MISAVIYKTAEGNVCGFKVSNHGESILCAAVSMLAINTVNSLETLTDSELECDFEPEGGYILCLVSGIISGKDEPLAAVLLRSLELGLQSAADVYGGGNDGIEIVYKTYK